MDETIQQLYEFFCLDISEVLTVGDMIIFTIKVAIACGLTTFIFKSIFKLIEGYNL